MTTSNAVIKEHICFVFLWIIGDHLILRNWVDMSFNVIDCFVFRNISLSCYHVGDTGYATYLTSASVCTRCIFINWRLKVGSSLGMVTFRGCKTKIAMLPSAGNNWCRAMQKVQNKNYFTTVNAWKRAWSRWVSLTGGRLDNCTHNDNAHWDHTKR